MSKTITTTIHGVDSDDPLLDMDALALLYGVTAAEINALPLDDGAIEIPPDWTQTARRRYSEATAHCGSDFILDVLAYWARIDHAAELKVVYA